MTLNAVQKLYEQYYVEKNFERADLFESLKTKYNIHSALYPGSFVHVTPSFFIPELVYVDNNKRAKKFFDMESLVAEFISKRKVYDSDVVFSFISSDFSRPLELEDKSFDLLISQYSGFVSQACKRYLRKDGILLANNSHGDAGIAFIDKDYEFIAAVYVKGGRHYITDKNLDSYFIPKKQVTITKEYLWSLGKGIAYTKSAGSYLFRKIS